MPLRKRYAPRRVAIVEGQENRPVICSKIVVPVIFLKFFLYVHAVFNLNKLPDCDTKCFAVIQNLIFNLSSEVSTDWIWMKISDKCLGGGRRGRFFLKGSNIEFFKYFHFYQSGHDKELTLAHIFALVLTNRLEVSEEHREIRKFLTNGGKVHSKGKLLSVTLYLLLVFRWTSEGVKRSGCREVS